VKNIAAISTTTGNVITTFKSNASGAVQTIVGVGNHLLVGGNFMSINGDTTDPYTVSLNPSNGKRDGFLHLAISGNYQYSGVSANATHMYNQSPARAARWTWSRPTSPRSAASRDSRLASST
jgi:hypothetical protein